MKNNIVILGHKDLSEYNDKIISELSKYIEISIGEDKSVNYKEIETDYFLENNTWHVDFFSNIAHLKEQYDRYEMRARSKNIHFNFNNLNLNREIKYLFQQKIFSNEWSISYSIVTQSKYNKRLADFINERYPLISSILEVDLKKANFEWINWLENNNLKTIELNKALIDVTGKTYYKKTAIACYLDNIYCELFELADNREEWIKDTWDIRRLKKYGIKYNKTAKVNSINFMIIKNKYFRQGVKDYFKQRLISSNSFSWGTAVNYMTYLPNMLNFFTEVYPEWNSLKDLKRADILNYYEYLNKYIEESLTNRNSNPNIYKITAISNINRFLCDIQLKEFSIAPSEDIRKLIYKEDKPSREKKDASKIDYVPDFVLEQLFDNINGLYKDTVPIVWIMYKTGLRISDVLGLKFDCLIKLNNKFWIETDIEKTYIKDHRIPIDNDLANMLAVLIHNGKQISNRYNNPEEFIFVRYSGKRKGIPYLSSHVQSNLNRFARKYSIKDEDGEIFYFKNHAFRHTYAIKMLNGGADILTVQELLAHASPEMTMRYAKLLDDTKRKVFDNAVKQGVFSFDESDKLKEENNGEIPSDIIDMLYTSHKLNALDTPYGTCMQRKNGKCSYAKQPPCLTCNNGSPCKDLCVGAFEGDTIKYEILINSTKNMIENAKMYSRTEMVNENEELLKLYEDIYSKISQGNMIYSRLDKLKKKVD